MGRLTVAQKEEKLAEAIALSVRGQTLSHIGEKLGLDRRTVGDWLKNEYARRAEHRDQEREEAIAFYEELKAERWRRLEHMPTDSRANNVVGLLNGLNADQSRIDSLTGVEQAQKHEHSGPGGGPIEHSHEAKERVESYTDILNALAGPSGAFGAIADDGPGEPVDTARAD